MTEPIRRVPVGDEGQSRLEVTAEVERLKGLDLAGLREEAKTLELPAGGDADSLRRLILERKLNEALGGETP